MHDVLVTFYPMITSYCIQVEQSWEWEQKCALAELPKPFEVLWGLDHKAEVIIVKEATGGD